MTPMLLVLLGAIVVMAGAVIVDELLGGHLEARGRAAIEAQQQAQAVEQRIQAITQCAVAEMLRIARDRSHG